MNKNLIIITQTTRGGLLRIASFTEDRKKNCGSSFLTRIGSNLVIVSYEEPTWSSCLTKNQPGHRVLRKTNLVIVFYEEPTWSSCLTKNQPGHRVLRRTNLVIVFYEKPTWSSCFTKNQPGHRVLRKTNLVIVFFSPAILQRRCQQETVVVFL